MSDTNLSNSLPYKSSFLAIVLFLAGPVGLLYTSWLSALILTILAIACSMIPKAGGSILMLIWFVSVFWNVIAVEKFNKKLLAKVFPEG
jgi:hypothetical protein